VSEQNPSEGLPPQPPQQSFGAAQPPPGQSFGAAPPPPGQSFGAAPPPPPMPAQPAEPAPKKKKGGVLRVIVPLVVVAVIAAGGWWFTRKEAQNAKVGDCLAGTSPEELNAEKLTIVPCTQSDAGFKVVERVENKTEAQSQSACTESTEDRWVYWYGERGGSGTVLCLGRNAPS
jgi:hypothetical protein